MFVRVLVSMCVVSRSEFVIMEYSVEAGRGLDGERGDCDVVFLFERSETRDGSGVSRVENVEYGGVNRVRDRWGRTASRADCQVGSQFRRSKRDSVAPVDRPSVNFPHPIGSSTRPGRHRSPPK